MWMLCSLCPKREFMQGWGERSKQSSTERCCRSGVGVRCCSSWVTNLLIWRGDIHPQLGKSGNALGMMQLAKCRHWECIDPFMWCLFLKRWTLITSVKGPWWKLERVCWALKKEMGQWTVGSHWAVDKGTFELHPAPSLKVWAAQEMYSLVALWVFQYIIYSKCAVYFVYFILYLKV